MNARRGLAAMALGAAAVAPAQADAAPAPTTGFQRILWLAAERAQDPVCLQRVRAVGFHGVNLGAGADPRPVVQAGLGYYLDQPAGKGLLELRDADWEPVRAAYEQQRDSAVLIRPTCLQDQAVLAANGARAAAAAAAVRGPALRFVALADEASATRHGNPLDVCRCARCLDAFRTFAQRRYATLAALNEAWATQFDEWSAMAPLTTDQLRRRELGGQELPANLRPFADWLDFVDQQFADAVAVLRTQVQREVPGVPVGLTGLQAPGAFGGHDYARLLPGLTLLEPYDVGGAAELARSLRPDAAHWFTLTLPDEPLHCQEILTARLCAAAAAGLRGAVVWNAELMFHGVETTPQGQALLRALAQMTPALDACAGAALQYSDVWLCESQASVRAWWMLDSAGDGMTWVRRLSSYEAAHSTSLAARRGWVKLLQDLGLQPRLPTEAELPELLLQKRPRVLVLPATIALGDRVCQAIASYVQNGGTVLADHSPALYDDHLHRRPAGGLDDLFGITARSPRAADLLVREGHRAREAQPVVAEAGLAGRLSERCGEGQVFIEGRPGPGRAAWRGRAVYLNLPVVEYAAARLDPQAAAVALDLRRRVRHVLQAAGVEPPFDVRGERLPTCLHRGVFAQRDGRRVLAVQVDALDRPELLLELARQPQRPVRVVLPRPARLRTLAGDDLGEHDTFELTLDVLAGLFVEATR